MEMIASDILSDIRQLSAGLPILAIVMGAVLWLAGWWSHRFWMVLGFTVVGGIWGLQNSAMLKVPPLVCAIGVGLAAGILALTVVRLAAFVAGGCAGLLLMHSALPAWDQPLISFLVGGLLGFVLFRYWTMALTSLSGVVLMGHAGVALVDRIGKLDAIAWCESNTNVVTTICGFSAFSGFAVQLLIDRLRRVVVDKVDKKDSKKPKADGILSASFGVFRRAG